MKKLIGWMIVGLTLGALPAMAFTLVKPCPPGFALAQGSDEAKFCCVRTCEAVPGCLPCGEQCVRERDGKAEACPGALFDPQLKRCCKVKR
ncbi:MAG: hypothetical protein HYW49_10955 [Deltaproteobacteria bacterium]|nr:hypothetical protein [Deltaproteobacteria bacterium]